MKYSGKRPLLMILLALLLAWASGCSYQPADAPDTNNGTNGTAGSDPAAPGTQTPSGTPGTSADPGTAKPGGGPTDPAPAQANTVLDKVTAVRLIDPSSGWIGGNGWIARTEDGGRTWKPQVTGTMAVEQIFALNGKEAWAVVADKPGQKGGGRLLHTSDGGTTWTTVGPMPNEGFLHFVSPQEGYAANARTTDGGKTWTTLPVPEGIEGDAYFHDANNGWAAAQVNDSLVVSRTQDGGKTWKTAMTRKTVAPLNGTLIRSAGNEDAWVVFIGESGMSQTSYSLFHTLDGGANWRTVIANSTAGAGPAPGFPIDDTGGPENAGSKPGNLYVVNPNVAFMGGFCPACDKPNTIGWTLDGGQTWVNGKEQTAGFVPSLLAFADAKNGWWISSDATEPSVMYTTADGGQTWTKVHTFAPPKQQ